MSDLLLFCEHTKFPLLLILTEPLYINTLYTFTGLFCWVDLDRVGQKPLGGQTQRVGIGCFDRKPDPKPLPRQRPQLLAAKHPFPLWRSGSSVVESVVRRLPRTVQAASLHSHTIRQRGLIRVRLRNGRRKESPGGAFVQGHCQGGW